MQILVIQSSINGEQSASNQLAAQLIAQRQQQYPQAAIHTINLAQQPIAYLDADIFAAFSGQSTALSDKQQQALQLSQQLIEQLKNTDEVVITLPIYNLGFPATLKTWLDYVCRAGQSFEYTHQGPKGLITGCKATILFTSGGQYSGSAYDTASAQLQNCLGLIGIDDVHIIRAEGLARTALKDEAMQQAKRQVSQLS